MMERMNEDNNTQQHWKKQLYEIIFKADTPAGKVFDVALIVCILISIIVVMLESVKSIDTQYHALIDTTEWIFTILFTIEYILRLICTPFKLRYVFSFYGIVDFLSILPTYLGIFMRSMRYLRVIRILRVLRIFRVLKLGNHIRQADILQKALYASRQKILVFLSFVMTLVVIIGAMMYMIEDAETGFTSIPRSVYWAIVTLTTVGYGDISPQTPVGQMLAALVMLLGYAIIAVPTGIVTSEIIRHDIKQAEQRACPQCSNKNHTPEAAYCNHCGTELDTV
jgi:voltage-gated potassium channel